MRTSNSPRRTRTRRTEKPRQVRKPKKQGVVIPFNAAVPRTLERRDARFIIYVNQLRSVFAKELIITFILIILVGIGSTAIHAQITNVQREIRVARFHLGRQSEINFTLDTQLAERYTVYEIEWIATERLGMARPDLSQIIDIYVSRQDMVTLNTAYYVLPQENYFWREIVTFVQILVGRIFGGS